MFAPILLNYISYLCVMNKSVLLFTILLTLILSCRREPISDSFRWRSITNESDSLMLKLELAYAHGVDADSLLCLQRQLDGLAKSNPGENQIKARSLFWEARIMNKERRHRECVEAIQKAYSMSDSVTYPYDHIRFRHLKAIVAHKSPPEIFHELKSVERYYSKTGDRTMLAHAYLDIGNMLNGIGDYSRAHEYYREADSLYSILGMKEFHLKTQINNAVILDALGEKEESCNILQALLTDSTAMADFDFYNNVCVTAYSVTHNPELLRKAYAQIKDKPEYAFRRVPMEADLAMISLKEGNTDSALSLIQNALHLSHPLMDISTKAYVLRSAAEIYSKSGLHEASSFLSEYLEVSDTLEKYEGSHKIAAYENSSEIMKYEEIINSRQMKERLMFWMALSGVVILSLTIIIIYMRRAHAHKLAAALIKIDLERDRRQLVSKTLAMTEKDNLLQSILDEIKHLCDEEKMPASDSKRLDSIIRHHLSSQSDWDSVVTQFEKVHPDFVRRLKERYPKVSEGDIRLAVYIKVGMQTKQIAKMLNVQPDSVKKNRHRLRERLGLSPDSSLEDTLRNLDS